MPKNVKMPDGSVVAFPDNMSDDAIAGVLKDQHPAAKPEQKGLLSSFADASPLSMIGQAIAHPIDTVTGLPGALVDEAKRSAGQLKEAWNTPSNQPLKAIDRTLYAIPFVGGSLKTADEQAAAGNYAGAVGSSAGVLTSLLAPEMIKGASKATRVAAEGAPDAYRAARSSVVGGSKLDEVINGDTVTPRQRYNAARDMGVNLDTAQATNAPVASRIKGVTEHSLGGASKFEENNAANVKALHEHSQKILDTASPAAMSREDFGNTVKAKLVQDQQSLNEQAGSIYKDLDEQIGVTKPDTTGIRQTAQKVVDANKDYYDAHPDMLSGGAKRAWSIIKNLADPKAPADSWSNLHKMRSDLLDITRGPEIIGDRPTGWIKQLTGAVDRSMTGIAGTPEADAFRDANEIYKHMKQTYDDPLSKLYHVVRSPDGLTAANSLANITPDVAKRIGAAAPELVPQLQRQAMSRILSPAGNDLPDLKNLSSRLSRSQKEQLAGVLTPEQIKSLDDLGRTSKLVTFDSNPSGSGKLVQRSAEGSAAIGGALRAAGGVVTGNPLAIAEGIAPSAWIGATRIAAKKLTNPAFTESIMNGGLKGTAKWAKVGEAKLLDHVGRDSASTLTAADITALSKTPKGKSLLIKASDLKPGSAAMKDLIKNIRP